MLGWGWREISLISVTDVMEGVERNITDISH